MVFLHSHLIQEAEKTSAAGIGAAPALKGRCKGAAGKKGGARAKEADDFDWASLRETAVVRLLESLELDLYTMCGHRKVEEPWLSLYSSAAVAVLEHAAAVKAASQPLREALWRLLSLPAVKHGQEVAAVTSLVSMVVTHE